MTTSSCNRKGLALRALLVSAIAAAIAFAQPAAAQGLHVSGTNVVEGNGNTFIMRGVNHGHAWFMNRTSAFADIKSYNSNVVRVVLSSGRWGTTNTPADVANVVSLCKANRMICVLENHDTTGYGEDGAAISLDAAVDYFATLQSVLAGQEDYVIINPGNEPIGNNNATQWISATTNAIRRLRSLGFQHLIMIDAPNWGQDWQYVMRDSAQTIWASDPNQNLVFSIHMYGVFNTPTAITSYLNTFRSAGLPLVIGEFGYRNNNSSNVDHDTVLAEAEARGMGYIGWSWCGNNEPYLDMVVNWDRNNLSPWGQRILNGPNGIVATAREATIFGTTTSYGLTVARAGTGGGTVTSSSGGINCGTACTASYPSGTSVTLTATAASGSGFAGWSGACVGTSATCVVSMTAARTVTATFNAVSTSYTLNVARGGTGSGTVTGPSINCGTSCTSAYASNTSVTLTATAASGSTFSSWSGCTSASGATCVVAMTQNRSVVATFTSVGTNYAVTVTKAGTGSGTVTSNTGGINCGTTCSATYASGSTVTLTAAAASGSTFGGWSGACTGTSTTCVLSMTAQRTVTATFNGAPTAYGLTVLKAGAGAGTVTGSGINCGLTCTASYASGTSVTLTATAASGSAFASWSGCASTSGATCTVSMTANRTVTATFNTSGGGTAPCANAITFTGNTNNFNTTGAVCYRTAQTINGWGCYNMDGRTVSVNNTAVTCGRMPLPAKWSDGYYYFSVTAGAYPWAGIYAW
ncbi:MAG TPA: cellulase family glycosylhydrolase [Anaeromyxobacter sp.]|nr:cellulase family glycosylhydrolase [Anaeromyxobacter sp.]